MNILRLQAENYGRFQHVDLEFPLGACALIGGNGAGKSRLLNAIELALFADGSRDLAPWLAPWAEKAGVPLTLELVFEHGGELLRVRRGYSAKGRGSATLDFEAGIPTAEYGVAGGWEPLTAENAAATQQKIAQTLGLSRRSFRASSFLAQGDAGAFTEASAVDRKSILGEVLDPRGLWPQLAEMARADAKAAEQALQMDAVKIAERELLVGGLEDCELRLGVARETTTFASEKNAEAVWSLEQTLVAQHANEAAEERHRAAKQLLAQAAQERERAASALLEAHSLSDKLPEVRERLEVAEVAASKIAELELLAEEQRTAALRAETAHREKNAANAAAGAQRLTLEGRQAATDALRQEFDQTAAKLNHFEMSTVTERCDRCAQLLGEEALKAAIASLREQARALNERLIEQLEGDARAEEELDRLTAAAQAIQIPEMDTSEDYSDLLARARQAAEQRSGLRVLLAAYEEQAGKVSRLEQALAAAEAALQARAAEMAQAAEKTQDGPALAQTVNDARARQQAAQASLDAAKAQCVRLEAELTRVSQAEAELQELKQAAQGRHQDLALFAIASKAFGRDGIPVLLVENVLGQIEADANRLLELMPTEDGVTLRVRLETRRALKTADHLRETLDVLVADQDGERPYETFSGGERSRLNICLRIALAVLLADRRGAESRLLAVDEVEYLDVLGQDQLVAVVGSVAERFDRVLVVSHSPQVREAFEQVVEITKRDGVSRVVGEHEPALLSAAGGASPTQ